LTIGTLAWLGSDRYGDREFEDLRVEPLTSQPGWEEDPALSPDGQSIAFTWSETLDGPRAIYVKRPGDAQPLKLTGPAPGSIGNLAWSPDGSQIAFKRQVQVSGALYTVPASGGDERKIVDLQKANLSAGVDWSPDGTQLAFSDLPPNSDQMVIYLCNLRSGEKSRLTDPPAPDWGDWCPRYSPDGRAIAFKRVVNFWADDLYLIPVTGGIPQRLTNTNRGIWGHSWTADGKNLIVSCQRSSVVFGIWSFPLSNPPRPERIQQGGVDAILPATGRKGQRMAWVNQVWDLNI
jgi:Tol biopolymer transport system component